jgi:hypothetical protein
MGITENMAVQTNRVQLERIEADTAVVRITIRSSAECDLRQMCRLPVCIGRSRSQGVALNVALDRLGRIKQHIIATSVKCITHALRLGHFFF